MSAVLILIISGFTGLFTLIAFRRAEVIGAAVDADPNRILISAQEFTIGGIFFGIITLCLVTLAIVTAVIESLNRR
jgi:hypothetical protein